MRKFQASIVDYSELEFSSLAYLGAMRDLHRAIDPHYQLPMRPRVTVHVLPGGALLLTSVEPGEARP